MSEQLKPCPFAHDTDEYGLAVIWGRSQYGVAVECSCGASGPRAYSKDEAIAAWNRRAEYVCSSCGSPELCEKVRAETKESGE